ncbi:hypothetical protein H5410_005314 [Solanum commersonii]|uniref:Uncharacterized protein n=1 Tax=Solanum commersonii TaxID=4109 RepID=A0A9J6A6U2_SOLCO|nr:hypothetical protein H5410_005314 [Solanum commersonii]
MKADLLSALCSTRGDNKSLNEENKSLNNRLSTLEDEMKRNKENARLRTKESYKKEEPFLISQSTNTHKIHRTQSAETNSLQTQFYKMNSAVVSEERTNGQNVLVTEE